MTFEMVLLGQFSWFWYHLKALNETNTILATTFKLKIWKEILNLIILIDNSEKRLTAIFELFLCQQSVFKVFQLLEKHLDQSEIPLQEVKKIRYWPLWGHWSRKIKDFEANSIIRSNIMREQWMKDTTKYYTSPLTTFLDIFAL